MINLAQILQSKLLLIILSFLLLHTVINSNEIYHAPIKVGIIGLPLPIRASLPNGIHIVWARLWIKGRYQNFFTPLSMMGSRENFYATIPKRYISLEGMEYYIEVYTEKLNKLYFPRQAPQQVQQIRGIPLENKIDIRILNPKQEAIQITGHPIECTLSVRGFEYLTKDYTITIALDNKIIIEKPVTSFFQHVIPSVHELGNHQLTISLMDGSHDVLLVKKRSFNVKKATPSSKQDSQKLDTDTNAIGIPMQWDISSSLKQSYQYTNPNVRQHPNQVDDTYVYTVEGGLNIKRNDYSLSIGPILVNSRNSTDGVYQNKFTFALKGDPLKAKWGHITSTFSNLSLNNIYFLGAELETSNIHPTKKARQHYGIVLLGGQTKLPIEQNIAQTRLGNYAERILATRLIYTPYPKYFFLSMQMSTLRDIPGSSIVHNSIPLLSNNSMGTLATVQFPSWTIIQKMDLEYAFSYNTTESEDSHKAVNHDHAFYLNLRGGKTPVTYELKIAHIRPYFVSQSNTFISDTAYISFNTNTTVWDGKATMQQDTKFSYDNIEQQKVYRTYTIYNNTQVSFGFITWLPIQIRNTSQVDWIQKHISHHMNQIGLDLDWNMNHHNITYHVKNIVQQNYTLHSDILTQQINRNNHLNYNFSYDMRYALGNISSILLMNYSLNYDYGQKDQNNRMATSDITYEMQFNASFLKKQLGVSYFLQFLLFIEHAQNTQITTYGLKHHWKLPHKINKTHMMTLDINLYHTLYALAKEQNNNNSLNVSFHYTMQF